MDFRVECCRFLDALGAVFLIVAASEASLKIDGFSEGKQMQSKWEVASLNHVESWACK